MLKTGDRNRQTDRVRGEYRVASATKNSWEQKMMKHQNDDFRIVQGYMKEKSIEKSRIAFKIRCEMIPEIK